MSKLQELNAAVKAQQKKYDEAVGRVPYVALLQIDRKLVRLEEERNALSDRYRELGLAPCGCMIEDEEEGRAMLHSSDCADHPDNW